MDGFKGQQSRDKPFPSYEDILDRLDSGQIFTQYIPDIKFNITVPSPLGASDKRPSFSVFWSNRKNKYLFKDHRYGWHGDGIDFVQYLFGFSTQTEACMQICLDFGIEGFYINENLEQLFNNSGTKVEQVKPKPRVAVKIQVTIRDWIHEDRVFWGQYGITIKWLNYARIFPIKYYYINGNVKMADKLAYAYVETKDGKTTYKIYQPYAEHLKKWISNNNSSVWELWNMLPDKHDILIITKSRKDALSIMATMNIPATSLQAEGTVPKHVVMDELKSRFKFILLLYDNDFDKEVNYGRVYGSKLADLFKLPQIELPEEFGEKDYSDLVKSHGIIKARKILWRIIKVRIIKHLRER
jgi:hypothetical protein